MEKYYITRAYILVLVIAVAAGCYFVFRPFLTEIIAAAILVSVFFRPYKWLTLKLGDRKKTASLIMCLLIAVLFITPLINFIIYATQKSLDAYVQVETFIEARQGIGEFVKQNSLIDKAYLYISENPRIKNAIVEMVRELNNWLTTGAAGIVKGTANFFVSIVVVLFSMFFFFIDGPKMLDKFTKLTPLQNKYDRELFKKFHDVSFYTLISTVVTAIAQGLVGAIGFMIIGLPAFFAGIAMAFFSLVPYVGPMAVWLPTSIYLLFVGKIWQAVFLIIWGVAVVGVVDNIIKAYIIKGKAQVHPMFVILSILGGIILFGFWGIVFGPLIISLAVTIMHIYEMEFSEVLDTE